MRVIDENTLIALQGSRAGDRLVVYAWYGGSLAYQDPLPVTDYSFNWDKTRQVQSLELTVADKDGALAPWLLSDPLGVGGSELEVRYEVGSAGTVNLGWYPIIRNRPEERWRSYVINNRGAVHADSPLGNDRDLVHVSGGATITVSAHDRAGKGKEARLVAPESPPAGSPTAVGEVRRLMKGICPVVTAAGVVDRAVSRNIVYERDRMDAVQDLCKRILCDYRMNGDGQLEIYPVAESAPVAVLQSGPEGLLVDVDREQERSPLRNVFVVDGTKENADGTVTPIRAINTIDSGELSIYGPFGMIPEFYSSNMIANQDDAEEYAFEMRVSQLSGMTVDLQVTCLPLPHLQQGDWVTVANPVVNGQPLQLNGQVKAMTLSGTGAPSRMSLTVQCSYWDVQLAFAGVRRDAY